MKLYYSPGACSLADRIALTEAGIPFDDEKVDLKTKKTETGADFSEVNPKGYVPALILDDGGLLTENAAILFWVSEQAEQLRAPGALGRVRTVEALAYISTEVHKAFAPFFKGGSDEEKNDAKKKLDAKFGFLAERMEGDYLFGDEPTVADCYLLVMLLWADKTGAPVPEKLKAFRDRMKDRERVKKALEADRGKS